MQVIARRSAVHTRRILEALPGWFGDPDAIESYVADVSDSAIQSFLAVEDNTVHGIALTRQRTSDATELTLLAVDPARRGQGVGRALVEHVARTCHAHGYRLLLAHTVGPSFDDSAWAETRAFYRAMGFLAVEERVGLDWYGPTLIQVLTLGE